MTGIPEESRVLIVAPTGRDASLIARLLADAGMCCVECSTLEAALCEAELHAGTIIVADEALSPGALARLQRFREAQPAWSDIPVIVLTRRRERAEAGQPSLSELGQVSVIERPVGRRPLLTAVQAALRARARQYEARAQFAEMERIGQELRLANSHKDQLLGLVSHELRTPLTGILGGTNILLRRFKELEPGDREVLLNDVSDQATRLQRIIENMLILSRAETTGDTNTEPVLLQRILPPLLRGLTPLRGARELRLTVQPDLPPANVNPVFVEQIVANLIRNSEKYAAENEPVEVRLEAIDDLVAITVADRGSLLTESQIAQMFDAFYRDPEHSARESGLGLGLPVCKRLTEVQGGSIRARPRPGGGLEVTVAFPSARE